MLQAIETTPQKYNNNNKISNTTLLLNHTTPSSSATKARATTVTPPTPPSPAIKTTTATSTPTTNNQSQNGNVAEEKQQRRRSIFYVPLVIEDDDDDGEHATQLSKQAVERNSSSSLHADSSSLGGQSSASNASTTSTTPERKSVASSSGSLSASGSKSKAEKNSNNNNLKKSTSLKNASATSKVAALLFERTNSTLGLGGSSSSSASSSATSGGVVKRSSGKKMSPPCGFNWTISGGGATDDTDLDEESDGGVAEQVKITSNTKKADKEKLKLGRLTQKSEKRHSTSSKSSIASNATTASLTKQSVGSKSSVNAKTKRYGIVLNGISLDDEHLQATVHTTTANVKTPTAKTTTPTKSQNPSNLVEFSEDDIMLATPTKQARSSRTSHNNNNNCNSISDNGKERTKHGKRVGSKNRANAMHDSNINIGDNDTTMQTNLVDTAIDKKRTNAAVDAECEYDEYERADDDGEGEGEGAVEGYDDDDDSEISRIQTNTSTPIKMMKSRSRTNILSVPSVEQHNLLSVAAAAVKPNAQNNNTTPLLLRAKSKTLPQNLSPSVVLQQPEALFDDGDTSLAYATQTKATKHTTTAGGSGSGGTSSTRAALRLIAPLSKVHHNLFGGSVASHIGAGAASNNGHNACAKGGHPTVTQHNKLAHSSSTSLITQTFPPKHLFLLKSTSKLPISQSGSSAEHTKSKATKSFSSDTTITSPPVQAACSSSASSSSVVVTSPAKKSLSFIRRAHSTKLSRNNSLLKSIASQHQQHIQQSSTNASASASASANMSGGNSVIDCSGSWGKDFYLNYDVCPLALDELETYFRSEQCTTLIRERFKILDIPLNCSAAAELHVEQQDSSLRELDTSCSSQQQLRETGTMTCSGTAEDDDAGHHSGELARKKCRRKGAVASWDFQLSESFF
uniref:Uncharacterized protein n=1 Tax=Ceratitis capitata TaxID=7213 RepID=W8ADC6_CERCA